MECTPLVVEGRLVGIVCSRSTPRKRCGCGSKAIALCDYPLAGKKRGATCSRLCCARCGAEWTTAAPVQPDGAYREKHDPRLDLCMAHHALVAVGTSPELLLLLAALRGTAPGTVLASRLERARLPERLALLDDGAARARAFLAGPRGHEHGAERVQLLGEAMGELAASVRAAGRPDEVRGAAARARQHLDLLAALPGPLQALPGAGGG